jgi:hypothetical protein
MKPTVMKKTSSESYSIDKKPVPNRALLTKKNSSESYSKDKKAQ